MRRHLLAFLLMGISLTGCDLFTEVPIPESFGTKENNTPAPTCQNNPCTTQGEYSCEQTTRVQCRQNQSQSCLLLEPVEVCSASTSLSEISTFPSQVAAPFIDVLTSDSSTLVVRQDMLRLFDHDDLSGEGTAHQLSGPATSAAYVTGKGYVLTTADALYQWDDKTPLPIQNATLEQESRVFAANEMVVVASKSALRTIDDTWNLTLEDAFPDTIKGSKSSDTEFYAVYGSTLYHLDTTKSDVVAQTEFDANILDIEVTPDTVWVLSQKSITPLDSQTFAPKAQAIDGLCGTGIALTQAQGWIWITDVGGCLKRIDPQGRALDAKTVDLNNKPGAPATTNYRPHAPTFAKGVGYAVAKTTQVVSFDPQTMEEIARRDTLKATTPVARPQAIDSAEGGVVVATQDATIVLKEQCPCL